MAVSTSAILEAALLMTRFEVWKETTGKTDFVEFLQRTPSESERVQQILLECRADYRRTMHLV